MEPRKLWREVRATDAPGELKLGPNTFDRFIHDPKRLSFYGARYSFAAKMLRDCETIVDVGCGDGFFTTTFLADTKAQTIVGIDFDEELIGYANGHLMPALRSVSPAQASRIGFHHADFLKKSDDYIEDMVEASDANGVVSMDCIEHIAPKKNRAFLGKIADMLTWGGIAIIGTPSEHAAYLGSPHSKLGHINNHTPESLRAAMREQFQAVMMFGLNDCMVHVGHEKLWHYIIAIGVKS